MHHLPPSPSYPTLCSPLLTPSSRSLPLAVLREVQRQSYDHLSLRWQTLDPETLCSMINDNQVPYTSPIPTDTTAWLSLTNLSLTRQPSPSCPTPFYLIQF
jgi:hypothetical protein